MEFVLGFIVSAVLALALTPRVRELAAREGAVDVPGEARKRHAGPVPLLGGLAVFASVAIAATIFWPRLTAGFLPPKHLAGILIGAAVLALGGALDDRFNLKPSRQLIFTMMAALIVIASGVGIEAISNPLGGTVRVDGWQLRLFELGGLPYHLTLPADGVAFVWLMLMMYSTKLLDGLDGLVSGLAAIGASVIAALSLTAAIGQPELALIALIVAGAYAGFLKFNRRPASIFLGEGGATMAGYLLGVLAITAGAKIGITLLVMAVPLLDVVWTVFRRVVLERTSFARADAGHLHFRLSDLGLGPAATVRLYWAFAAAFGFAGLLFNAPEYGPAWKAGAFLLLVALFLAAVLLLGRKIPKP